MRVLVTGAGGLVGGAVVAALAERGHEARAMLRPGGEDRVLRGQQVQVVRADLEDPPSLHEAARDAEVVVHCAAMYSYDAAPQLLQRINVDGTRSVLEVAARAGARRVVLTSSSVTCGSSAGPESRDESGTMDDSGPAYFASKRAQEQAALQMARELGIELVVACPTVVLGGPDPKLVPSNAILVRYLLDPTRSTFPGGGNVVAAGDVGAGIVLLAEVGEPGRRYLLGGENWTWRLLHTAVSELAGLPGPFLEAGATASYLVAGAAELVSRVSGRPPLVTRDEALTIGRYHWYDDRRARALGYTSRPARRAVAEALGWLSTSDHLPRVVREWTPWTAEVVGSRRLLPAPLGQPAERRLSARRA